MKDSVASNDSPLPGKPDFATTQWSVVLAAGEQKSKSKEALAALCQEYWYPLYAFVRRKGYQSAEAQDLTQAFFAELLEKQRLQMADRTRGRFRSFLLSSLKNFLHNDWRGRNAQKRGGRKLPLQIDFEEGDERYSREPTHDLTAERIYQRRWAMTFLENAIERLSDEFHASDKGELFDNLKPYLGGGDELTPYSEMAERLGISESNVKVIVHRMRKRCREILLADIAETVESPGEVEDELQILFASLE